MGKYKLRKHRRKSKPHVSIGKHRNKFSAYFIENSKVQNKKYGGLNKQEICKSVLLTLFLYNESLNFSYKSFEILIVSAIFSITKLHNVNKLNLF